MARKANPALIGAFVLGAVVLAVVGLVVFGGGKFFRQTQKLVVYFDESVKGLAIGAPVMFTGVKVGSVTDIKVVVDREQNRRMIPVFFEIEADRFTESTGTKFRFTRREEEAAQRLIEQGLRAQLEMQSLVTGQLSIQLEFHPDTPIRLVGLTKGLLEMPSIPSSTERLTRAIDNLPLDKIASAALNALQGIEGVVNDPNLKQTLATLRETVASTKHLVERVDAKVDPLLGDVQKLARSVDGQIAPLAATVDKTLEAAREAVKDVQALVRHVDADVVPAAKDTLQDTRALVKNVDGRVAPLVANLEKTLAAAASALEDAQRVMATVDETVAEGSPLQSELLITLRDLGAAARAVRGLSDYVERHPESLVFGKNGGGR